MAVGTDRHPRETINASIERRNAERDHVAVRGIGGRSHRTLDHLPIEIHDLELYRPGIDGFGEDERDLIRGRRQ